MHNFHNSNYLQYTYTNYTTTTTTSTPTLHYTTLHYITLHQHATMKPFIAIPAIALLVHRAWSRKSLTALGLVAALLTAIAHAVHPWSAPFFLLVVFYLGGTKVTKVLLLLLPSTSYSYVHF